MKKLLILLFALSALGSDLLAYDYKIQLSEYVSIDFPQQPKITQRPDTKVYVYAEEGLCLMAQVLSAKTDNITEAHMAEFNKGFTATMLQEFNAQLISQKEIEIQGYKALEINYRSDGKNGLPENYTQRAVLLGDKVYTWFFVVSNDYEKSLQEQKNQFMNSLKIDSKGKEIKQYSMETDAAYESGKQMGELIGLILIVALLVGLFFVLRWILRLLKRNREQL